MRKYLAVLFLGFLALCADFGSFNSAAIAQEELVEGTPDYLSWEDVALRAETALADGRASSTAFEELRKTLVVWRSDFSEAKSINAARIVTLDTQIAALEGAQGSQETPEIIARRSALIDERADIAAPGQRAGEAYNQAIGLIGEIDTLIRQRDARQLVERGTSPLSPSSALDGLTSLWSTATAFINETRDTVGTNNQTKKFSNNLIGILVLSVLSLFLFLRVPNWVRKGIARISTAEKPANRQLNDAISGFVTVLSLTLGGVILAEVFLLTAVLGFRGQILVDALRVTIFSASVGWFVGPRLLVSPKAQPYRRQMSQLAMGLGIVWSVDRLIGEWAAFDLYSNSAISALHFPFIVIASVLLYQLARVVLRENKEIVEADEIEMSFRRRVQHFGRYLALAVSFIAPIAAVFGFSSASLALIFPTILTLLLAGTLVATTNTIRALYSVVRGKDEAETQASLVPVLVNFSLVLASLPLLALIWGARVSQLGELWSQFLTGIVLGETRISPTEFITFAIVFVLGFMATRILQSVLRGSVLPKTRMDVGGQTAVVSGIGYVGIFLAGIIALSAAGLNLSSLAIVAGALSVGIGFGLQNIVSNFVSGIILLVERPIAEGDWIEVGGQHGTVRDISVRSTRIETFDRSDVIVPNADLVSGTVTNYTRGNLIGRVIVPISVAYGTDTKRVSDILQEIAEAHPMVTLNPPPSIYFDNFGADGMDFEIRAILRDVNWVLSVKSDLNHEIARRFGEENIEIPFVQRDIWLRNPEVLTGSKPEGEKT